MATKVTFASMMHTDGHFAAYGIYTGTLRKDGTIRFNRQTRQLGAIATLERFCYRCTEEQYATEAAPPVPWKTHQHSCGKQEAGR